MQPKAIEIKKLEKHASNIYEAIVVTAKRAREINDLYKIEFNNRISNLPKIKMDEEVDEFNNKDQAKISIEFEKRLKPHQLALEEMLNGKIKFRYPKFHKHHHHK
mgnify:FL=1